MVELRKRKAPAESLSAEKKAKVVEKAISKTQSRGSDKQAGASRADPSPVRSGDTIPLDGFGGEIETNEGVKTTLKTLVDSSKSGVVIFTYPRASTPGCTRQACLFRDNYERLTSTGLSIYGLSTDSPKANTSFKTKQNLPYSLLCDPKATLIAALGFKKAPKGTIRGVVVVDKAGKILLLEQGGPAATVDAVHGLVAASSHQDTVKDAEKGHDGSPSGM